MRIWRRAGSARTRWNHKTGSPTVTANGLPLGHLWTEGNRRLTEADYDALYAVVKEDMPRIPHELVPLVLEQLIRAGEPPMVLSDAEIEITNTVAPQLGVYRVIRNRAQY